MKAGVGQDGLTFLAFCFPGATFCSEAPGRERLTARSHYFGLFLPIVGLIKNMFSLKAPPCPLRTVKHSWERS